MKKKTIQYLKIHSKDQVGRCFITVQGNWTKCECTLSDVSFTLLLVIFVTGPFLRQTFLLGTAGKAQMLLMTSVMASFYLNVAAGHDSVTVSKYAQDYTHITQYVITACNKEYGKTKIKKCVSIFEAFQPPASPRKLTPQLRYSTLCAVGCRQSSLPRITLQSGETFEQIEVVLFS